MPNSTLATGILALLAGCQADVATVSFYDCDFTDLGAVDPEDPGSAGFTASEVISAASVDTTALTAPTADIPQSFDVALTHKFVADGEPHLVDYGQPADAECPAGLALHVPARYDLTGTIGGWEVSTSTTGFSLVAMAADITAISSHFPSSGTPVSVPWDADVEQGLQDLARTTLPSIVSANCTMGFSLVPKPDNLAAGAWGEELQEGTLGVECENYHGTLLTWDGVVTSGS